LKLTNQNLLYCHQETIILVSTLLLWLQPQFHM